MATSPKRGAGTKKNSSSKRGKSTAIVNTPFVDNLFETTEKVDVRIVVTRGAGEPLRVKKKDHRDDDIVELRLQGGVRLLTRLDDFQRDFPAARARGGGAVEDDFIEFGNLPAGEATRGLTDMIIEGLRIIGIDPIGAAGELTGEAVCKWYERKQLWRADPKHAAEQRIWQIDGGDTFKLVEPDLKSIDKTKPILLFIHGTASSSQGSFSELWAALNQNQRRELFAPYGKQVLAFEHFSLTESPVQNAIALVDKLPANSILHLVTHSRGGIVGELLCRGELERGDPFTTDEIKRLFVDADGKPRAGDQADLQQLSELLLQKRLRIERFVRAGCPARGTTLASERLDRWLSILLNLFGDLSTLSATPFFSLFEDFAKAFIKTRTNPDRLPGLAAQMPTAPLIRLLNQRGIQSRSDLHVVSGDIEGSGVLKRFGVFLTDLFFREDHDLVVNTSAMYGGAVRTSGARFFFDHGPQVNHFSYFKNDTSVKKLVSAMRSKPETDEFKPFMSDIPTVSRSYRGPAASRGIGDGSTKPIVFLLPGIMGSHLSLNEKRIWLEPLQLAAGGVTKLGIDVAGVKADAPIESSYGKLQDHLSQFYDVVPFAFDWRRSLLAESARLAAAIEDWLTEAEKRNQPLSLLAHSMGGLLARVMIADQPKLWERICKHDRARFVMLGTPNGGSYSIPRLLLGKEGIIQGLSLVDFKNSQGDLLKVIAKFPGVLEMLPTKDVSGIDFFSPDEWTKIAALQKGKWTTPDKDDLKNAQKIRALLDQATPNPERLCYVAGCAHETPMQLVLKSPPDTVMIGFNRPNNSPEKVYFESSRRGDGRVLWDTGILPDVKTWYMDAVHGDMPACEPAFNAIVELLQFGKTELLPVTAPVVESRAVTTPRAMTDVIEIFPDDRTLEALAVGGTTSTRRSRVATPKAKVSIAHGNLSFASHPVAVGHYAGDTIVSAEHALDRALDGSLTRAHQLGLYPGPVNTAKIWLNPSGKPSGAIVIGLGPVGELTPNQLTDGFTRAMLSYALESLAQQDELKKSREQNSGSNAGGRIDASVSALLIGTTAGGLPIRDALSAILRGFARANRGLIDAKLDQRILLSKLQFIELYEDRAILAAHTLKKLQRESEIEDSFEIETTVQSLTGGRRRAYFDEAPGWWQRIEIIEEDSGNLKFTVLTDRARAEVRLLPTQRALVDQFLADATKSTQRNDDVPGTLFELLIPNELKDHAPERRDTVLVLDDKAARYPWELLVDRLGPSRDYNNQGAANDDKRGPLAVKAGIIRQRKTEIFREKPVSAPERTALVIGNPKVDDDRFVPLDGAEKEASAVEALLVKRGFDTTLKNGQNSDAIVTALFAKPYRILHLAGHGVYQFPIGEIDATTGAKKLVSGMVIGKDTFITPGEIAQMRWVPDLVFINCCYSGESHEEDARRDRNRLAANISTQLIDMGVRAVVAAGWAVDDAAAKLFAEIFYDFMLAGEPFGIAVREARKKVYEKIPGSNTWGAYQCYGDPDFSLSGKSESSMKQEDKSPLSIFEATTDIDSLAEEARAAAPDSAKWLLGKLDKMRDGLSPSWLASGALNAALGRAYGELDQFERAVKYYGIALKAPKADYPSSASEQLSNFEIRWAVQQYREATKNSTKDLAAIRGAQKLITGAVVRLNTLTSLARTSERLNLLGSAWKRVAQLCTTSEARVAALKQMALLYREAGERSKEESGIASYYSISNWITACALIADSTSGNSLSAELENSMQIAERGAKNADENNSNFWTGAAAADCKLTRCLAQGNVGEYAQDIADVYLRAKHRGGSAKEWRSVLEHIEFLQAMVSPESSRQSLANGLGKLASLLDKKSEKTLVSNTEIESPKTRGDSTQKSGKK